MKKILIVVSLVVLVIALILVGGFLAIFGNFATPRSGPALDSGIEQVADSIATIFMLDVGGGKVALIDAGNNDTGAPILDALKRRAKTPDDVAAIFITHAHPDHDAAVSIFPNAEVFAMQDEVEVAAGKEAYRSPLSRVAGRFNPHPFKVTHPLHDGETVRVGDLEVTAFEVSGHTPGSTLYLARGVLFVGDAFNLTRGHKIEGPVRLFSRDADQGIRSLRTFLQKLGARESEIKFIATSHTGNIEGPEGLRLLREFLATQGAQ
jgi:glyoxylase-like metal-dependent hydrolase (beta-lactamase superfamily II)